MPGVRAIFHRANIGKISRSVMGKGMEGICVERRPPFEDDIIRYYGQYVAAVVALTYEQQLAAYRFLQKPDTLHLVMFRARGESVYLEIRGYLFHELSMDARLQVENIKETHQQFEVAAERHFLGKGDLVEVPAAQMDHRWRQPAFRKQITSPIRRVFRTTESRGEKWRANHSIRSA